MNKLHPYIEALGARLGLPLEMTSPENFMVLLNGKALFIREMANGNEILFHMEIGRPSIFRRGELFATLLGYNLFLTETNGAALSYNDATEMMGLNLVLPLYQMDAEAFINVVDNFAALAEDWSRKLDQLNTEFEERARTAGDAFMSGSAAQPQDTIPGMHGMLKA